MASRAVRWLATGIILVVASACALLALGAHLQLTEARDLVAKGNAIEGTVTDVDTARKSTSSRMSYTYTVASGPHVRLNQSVPFSEAERLRRGAKIKVWLDPAKPEIAVTAAEMAEHESVVNRMFFPLASLALFAWAIARIMGGR